MTSTKSAECVSLETALTDLWKQLERSEKRLNREEDEYIQTTMLHQTPPFGSLFSGWEGILEGTKVDVHRGKEKVYTRECYLPGGAPSPLFLFWAVHPGDAKASLDILFSSLFIIHARPQPPHHHSFHPCFLDLSPPI